MTEKKGFVLYFDAASSLAALCAAQRGELLLALFDYAERTAKQPLSPETALASYPALDEQTPFALLTGCSPSSSRFAPRRPPRGETTG